MLKNLAKDLWVAEAPQRFMGVDVGTRMTIIRLNDGSLFLHSPIALTELLKKELQALGKPKYVVAPNCFHHLYVGEYPRAFPDIQLYLAPGLHKKRSDLKSATVLTAESHFPWSKEIDFHLCRGMPKLNEMVFYHRASRTLIVSDLVFNFTSNSSLSARLFALATGIYGKVGLSWLDRKLFIRDPIAAAQSFDKILEWDIERIILAHGDVVDKDAHEKLQNALS